MIASILLAYPRLRQRTHTPLQSHPPSAPAGATSQQTRRIFATYGFLFLMPWTCVPAGAEVPAVAACTVLGKIRHSQISASGKEILNYTEEFKITLSGSHWLISERLEGKEKTVLKETGFDGTNTYQLAKFPPELAAPGKPHPITTHISINDWDMPAPDPMFNTSLIWLAYASSGTFPTGASGGLRPVWILQNANLWRTGYKIPATWRVNLKPPFLPESIDYFDDSLNHRAPSDITFAIPGGPPDVIYSAALTNTHGLELPARFTMTHYYPSSTNAYKSIAPLVFTREEGSIESIGTSGSIPSFRPEVLGEALVSDCRVISVYKDFAFRYFVTNNNWGLVSRSDLVARAEIAKSLPTETSKAESSGKRYVSLAAMLLATTIFAGLLAITGRAQKPE